MTIHEEFACIHEAGLLDHARGEPQQPAGRADPASPVSDATRLRQSAGAFAGLIPSCLRPRAQTGRQHCPNSASQ